MVGSTIKIKNAPTIVPIKAPKTGIKAVKPTKTEIVAAYGILSIIIPIKHNIPIMIASKNWPLIKLPKVLLDNSLISTSFFCLSSDKYALDNFLNCLLKSSFFNKT